ncbi:MAG: hypothetical protein Q9217_001912 [Psora testacea]
MAEAVSGMTGSLQGSLQGLADKGTSIIDSIIAPETRNKIVAWISKFATERPMLASFIASHIALTGFPLGLFIIMTISVAIFAIIAALILALLGAVVFIVFCVGVALIFLLPTLFITTGIATFIWLWGVGAYYILKRFNQKSIPGIHKPLKEGLQGEASDYADKAVMEGHGQGMLGNGSPEGDAEGKGKQEREKVEANGVAKQGGKNNAGDVKASPKEAADVGKAAGKVTGAAGGAKDATKGITG